VGVPAQGEKGAGKSRGAKRARLAAGASGAGKLAAKGAKAGAGKGKAAGGKGKAAAKGKGKAAAKGKGKGKARHARNAEVSGHHVGAHKHKT